MASKDDSFSNSAAEVPLQIAGRRWVVEYAPSAVFNAAQPHEQSSLVLISGLAITFLLTGHLYGGWKRTRQIARVNAALQDEIAVRKKS